MRSSANALWACCALLVLGGQPGGAAFQGSRAPGSQQAAPQDPTRDSLVPLVLTQIEPLADLPDPSEAPESAEPPALVGPAVFAAPEIGQVTPPLAVTQLDDGRARLDALDGDERLSLRFSEPLPITELLLFLFRDTPFSIVPEPGVQGDFIGELKDVSLLEALDLVLHPHGFDYAVRDSSIVVFPRRLETRIFPLDHVMGGRSRRSTGRTESEWSAMTGTDGDPSNGALVDENAADLFDDLSAGVRTLLSPEGRFNVDRHAALVQVTDSPDRLTRVAVYLDAVSSRVNRQVLLQAEVAEVALNERYASGIDWPAVREAMGVDSLRVEADGVRVGVPRSGSAPLLAALRKQGEVNVLARPRVVTMNNEQAVMRVGTQDVLFASTSHSDGVELTGRALVEGLVLRVTPRIAPNGVIGLSISQRLTNRTGSSGKDDGAPPVLSVREADTVVRVFEGETVVVAGLMQDHVITTRGKVPVVGSIPLLGRMFRRNRSIPSKTDLVILLTPRIVAPGRLTAALTRH